MFTTIMAICCEVIKRQMVYEMDLDFLKSADSVNLAIYLAEVKECDAPAGAPPPSPVRTHWGSGAPPRSLAEFPPELYLANDRLVADLVRQCCLEHGHHGVLADALEDAGLAGHWVTKHLRRTNHQPSCRALAVLLDGLPEGVFD